MATDTKAPDHPGMPPTSRPPQRRYQETETDRIYRGVSFASDTPIPWILGRLKLGKCDSSRMQSSGCPVLRGHDGNQPIGEVLNVDKIGGVWRSDWRLPRIAGNQRTFDEMDSNINRGISVGGSLVLSTLELLEDSDDMGEMVFTADWVLVEQSLTPIPADVAASVDRAMVILERDAAIFDTVITEGLITSRDTAGLRREIDAAITRHREIQKQRRLEREMTTQAQVQDIPQELIERAIAVQLERSESLKALTQLPGEIARLSAHLEEEEKRNMEYRAKLDRLQFQPGGMVLQADNWQPHVNRMVDFGKILRLSLEEDIGLPELDRANDCSLEESIIERANLGKPGRNVVGRIPFAALAAYEDQLQLQRITTANAAGARPLDIQVVGDGGLLLSAWAPILSRMQVRVGVSGGQKAPWATTQPTAAAGAEGADITVSNLVLDNTEYLPKSIASAYEFTSALRGVDDGTVQMLSMMAIREVLQDEVTKQVLVGGGTNEIQGIWGTTNVPNHDYGAAQTNFDRQDVLDWFNAVRLAKTDGERFTAVLSSDLWKLCEQTPRGTDGTDSAGYTEVTRFLLEPTGPHMGMMESVEAFHYADLAVSSVNDPGLMFKADRMLVWFWGDSLTLQFVPQVAAKDTYKMIADCNMVVFRPAQNASRIKRT